MERKFKGCICIMIYAIGDSHVRSFGNEFTKIALDPTPTAYQNVKRIGVIKDNLSGMKKDTDKVIFSFGEVDVRCHLGFIADRDNRTHEDVVSECVVRYGKFLDHFIGNGYKVGVWGAVPSGEFNGVGGNGRPSYKTHVERNNLTKLFNGKLEKMCLDKKISYNSIFDMVIEDSGNYGLYFSMDNIHLNGGDFKNRVNGKDCEKLIRALLE